MADEENFETPVGPSAETRTAAPRPQRPGYERTETSDTIRTLGWLKLRGQNDDLPQRWWFASKVIPLLAATTGPFTNVLSIAALVSPWRLVLPNNGQLPEGTDDEGVSLDDPHWEIVLNAVSLAAGFTGNIFLLLNFTGRVRYIVALPLSIIFWILASWILIAVIIGLHTHLPVEPPSEIYSQGFWHAVMASILYFLNSAMLLVNMLGYFKGHYPQDFDLDDDQRTLILQTMMFFFWLAGGAGLFCRIEGLTYVNALYFADMSILTIGFGDIYPRTDGGRGFLFVFQLVGIIFLGLVIGSITRFASNISADKIVRSHQQSARESCISRAVTNERELRERLGLPPSRKSLSGSSSSNHHNSNNASCVRGSCSGGCEGAAENVYSSSPSSASAAAFRRRESLSRYGRLEIVGRSVTFRRNRTSPPGQGSPGGTAQGAGQDREKVPEQQRRRQKLLLLREEKDRFDAMREIQELPPWGPGKSHSETLRFKQYWALGMALLAFGVLWCSGALIFMLTERRLLDLSYFQALYFCFISLLTIGYGDFSPKSNVGKPFFILWSLVAVPTITILIQQTSKTVVQAINHGTFKMADWTVLPQRGVVAAFLASHPRLQSWLQRVSDACQRRRLISRGMHIDKDADRAVAELQASDHLQQQQRTRAPDNQVVVAVRDKLDAGARPEGEGGRGEMAASERLCTVSLSSVSEDGVDDEQLSAHRQQQKQHDLACQLAAAIKSVARDLRSRPPRRYSYEEWVLFTKLIRFSSRRSRKEVERLEDEEGMVEWDWIGEDSPMLADESEAQWVLDRLCESLHRYTRRQANRNSARRRHLARCVESMRPETIPEAESDVCSGAVQAPTPPSFERFEDPEVKAWVENLKGELATGCVSDKENTVTGHSGQSS